MQCENVLVPIPSYFSKDMFTIAALDNFDHQDRSLFIGVNSNHDQHVSSIKRVKTWFFVTFNIILRHIFPENFIEFPQVVQKILRNSQSILANFHQFSSIFWIF